MGGRRLPLYEHVRREQVKALAANLPHMLAGNLANLAVALYLLYGILPPVQAALWAGALAFTVLARIPLYRRTREGGGDPERALRLHALGAGASGVAWGTPFLLLPPLSHIPTGIWLVFQVAGISAGAAVLDSVDRRVVAAFLAPLVLAFTFHLAVLDGSAEARLLAGLVLLYGLVLVRVGGTLERRFVRLARLSAERTRLLEERLEERRRVEAERVRLESACARWRAIADALPVPFALFPPDGTGPELANAAFRVLLDGPEGVRLFARVSALARRATSEGVGQARMESPEGHGLRLEARRLGEGVLVWAVPDASSPMDGGGDGQVAATGPTAPPLSGPRG